MSIFNKLVGNAIDTVNYSTGELAKLGQSLAANTQQLIGLSTVSKEEGRQAVAESAQAAGMKAAAGYQQRSTLEKAQNILNINPDVADNELQLSTNALNASQRAYKEARVEYDQITQTELLDNPIGYIFGQLKLPQVAARVNAASDAQAAAEGNIATRLDIANKYKSTIVANTASTLQQAELLQASADSHATNVALAGKEAENASRIAGAQLQQAGIFDKINDNKVRVVGLQLQAAQMDLNQAQRAVALEQAKALREDRVKKINDSKEADDLWNARLKPLGKFLGMGLELNTKTIKAFKPEQQQALVEAASSGTLGDDLFSSLKLVAKMPGRGNIAATNPGAGVFLQGTSQAIDNYAQRIESQATKTGQKVDQKTLTATAAADYQADVMRSSERPDSKLLLSSPTWDTTFNPRRADHAVMADLVAGGVLKGLAKNPMLEAVNTVKSTLQGRPFTVEDEQRALLVIRDRVAKRELHPREAAAQVATYYRTATQRNAVEFQTSMFGMPEQTSYYYSLKPVGLLGDAIKADLMNPASLERAFTADVRGMAQVDAKYGGQLTVSPLTAPIGALGTAINNTLQGLFSDKK